MKTTNHTAIETDLIVRIRARAAEIREMFHSGAFDGMSDLDVIDWYVEFVTNVEA